jgi:hypothetical protein
MYQRGSQNPYIEEEKTTQWPKERGHDPMIVGFPITYAISAYSH